MKPDKETHTRLLLAGRITQDRGNDSQVSTPAPADSGLAAAVKSLENFVMRQSASVVPVLQSLADTQAMLVQQPPEPPKRTYEFTFHRDANGFLTSITATEK